LNKIAARVRQMQGDDATTPVVISADRNVKYEAVVKLMDTLQRAGIQRVGLSVKNST
jgi:biopolymer transport protein TolR